MTHSIHKHTHPNNSTFFSLNSCTFYANKCIDFHMIPHFNIIALFRKKKVKIFAIYHCDHFMVELSIRRTSGVQLILKLSHLKCTFVAVQSRWKYSINTDIKHEKNTHPKPIHSQTRTALHLSHFAKCFACPNK